MKKKILPMLLLTAMSLVGCSSTNGEAQFIIKGGSGYHEIILDGAYCYFYCITSFKATKKDAFNFYASEFYFLEDGMSNNASYICLGSDVAALNPDETLLTVENYYHYKGNNVNKGWQDYVYVFFTVCPTTSTDTVYYRGTCLNATEALPVSVYNSH